MSTAKEGDRRGDQSSDCIQGRGFFFGSVASRLSGKTLFFLVLVYSQCKELL
jgi:hypothetical protein